MLRSQSPCILRGTGGYSAAIPVAQRYAMAGCKKGKNAKQILNWPPIVVCEMHGEILAHEPAVITA